MAYPRQVSFGTSEAGRDRTGVSWDLPPRYRFREKIGSGSYGQVAEVEDLESWPLRLAAIKRVDRIFSDLIDSKRILREISILSRLNNPCVVSFYDICCPRDPENFSVLNLVLELCDSDLQQLSRKTSYIGLASGRTLLHNLLRGVKYLHSAGILHRDLKPANCLVMQNCEVKICDFGLSRTVGLASQPHLHDSPLVDEQGVPIPLPSDITTLDKKYSLHVATRYYRAPELILLQENYSGAIDMWSVGCIFGELLNLIDDNGVYFESRKPLFEGQTCFPLSPGMHGETPGSSKDQLAIIFDTLGTPSDEVIDQLEKPEARKYIRLFRQTPGTGLRHRYPGTSEEGLDLLERMLVFDHRARITVDEALAHPWFTEEQRMMPIDLAHEQVILDFETEPCLDEPRLRKYFLLEVKKFHPELEVPPQFAHL
mmetsp:Transcript_88971/g.203495  ORF Transcript_88971/g.203495 Transcript_88971/m.203495 type:complete len:427 (-) Transcript_88971:183-1463(-)